jgi:hypothetical protein
MFKKNLFNPSYLFLLAGNVYCIWYYENHPNAFVTVVWIYWFQSITIGVFNFLDLLTIKNYETGSFKLNNNPVSAENKGCVSWFFLFHYGFFHIGYAVFLIAGLGITSVNKRVLLIGIGVFFLESIMNFMRQKKIEQTVKLYLGYIFFLPYLRIIPMHLMILLPAFFGWKPSTLFLVLKMGADIVSFFLYHHINGKTKIAGRL